MSAHGPIEPRAAVALWRDDALNVWAGTQDAFYIRDFLIDAFSLRAEAVTVQTCRIGGAFGGKTICTVEASAAALTLATGAPVKVQWTRAQEYALGFHRPPSSHRIRARLAEGRIIDWDHAQMSSHIMFTAAAVPAWMQRGTDLVAGDGGVARGMAALAESAIDEAAIAAGDDPLIFRLTHITDPYLASVLRRVGEIASWGNSHAMTAGQRAGRGIACDIYNETSYAAAVADLVVDARGRVQVTRLWCVHDCGLVINPDQVRAQFEGNLIWSLGMVLTDDLPIENGNVTARAFGDAPIPRLTEVRPINVDLIQTDHPPKGAGETAIVAGPGAVANAIRAATGRRPTRFPVKPEDLAM